MESQKELNMHIARNKTKTKTVEYDYYMGKPKKETIEEKEEIRSYIDIIDRQGLKMLASALKDLNEIINSTESNENNINKVQIINDLPSGDIDEAD